MGVTVNFLNNNKLSNIMKTYSVYEKPLVGNHGGRHCKNFLKKEFWHVKLFLVKHNSIFGVGY